MISRTPHRRRSADHDPLLCPCNAAPIGSAYAPAVRRSSCQPRSRCAHRGSRTADSDSRITLSWYDYWRASHSSTCDRRHSGHSAGGFHSRVDRRHAGLRQRDQRSGVLARPAAAGGETRPSHAGSRARAPVLRPEDTARIARELIRGNETHSGPSRIRGPAISGTRCGTAAASGSTCSASAAPTRS